MSVLMPTANSGQPTGSLYEKTQTQMCHPTFTAIQWYVTQGLNILEAENWAKCRGDPKVARDRSGPEGGGRDLGINSLQRHGVSPLGRVWPYSSV